MTASLVNANRLYKITRSVFGLNKAIQPHLTDVNRERANPFRQTKACSAIIDALRRFRQTQTRVGAWFTGTDKLICLLHAEMDSVDERLDVRIKELQKIQKQTELKSLPGLPAKFRETHATVLEHLTRRLAFIKQAPLRPSFFTIPSIFERFRGYQQIRVYARVNEGQPATYRNLMDIKRKNQEILDSSQPTLGIYSRLRHETFANQVWEEASDAVDGALSAQGYADRGIKWLKESSSTVVIDEKGNSSWKPAELRVGTQEKAIYSYR